MSLPRAIALVLILAGVGVGLVQLRRDVAAAAMRLQHLHQVQIRLRSQLWQAQMELAQPLAPQRLRQRLGQMGLVLVPAWPADTAQPVGAVAEGPAGSWLAPTR